MILLQTFPKKRGVTVDKVQRLREYFQKQGHFQLMLEDDSDRTLEIRIIDGQSERTRVIYTFKYRY